MFAVIGGRVKIYRGEQMEVPTAPPAPDVDTLAEQDQEPKLSQQKLRSALADFHARFKQTSEFRSAKGMSGSRGLWLGGARGRWCTGSGLVLDTGTACFALHGVAALFYSTTLLCGAT